MVPSARVLLGFLAIASASPALDFRSFAPLIERQASEIPAYVSTYGKQDDGSGLRVWVLIPPSSGRLVVLWRNILPW